MIIPRSQAAWLSRVRPGGGGASFRLPQAFAASADRDLGCVPGRSASPPAESAVQVTWCDTGFRHPQPRGHRRCHGTGRSWRSRPARRTRAPSGTCCSTGSHHCRRLAGSGAILGPSGLATGTSRVGCLQSDEWVMVGLGQDADNSTDPQRAMGYEPDGGTAALSVGDGPHSRYSVHG